jgi:hypothetical protein
MDWATFWATFLQTHLVTLLTGLGKILEYQESIEKMSDVGFRLGF